MQRYLMRISYMGTHFKSFVKNVKNGVEVKPSVMGVIEHTLETLNLKSSPRVQSISRTDRGVHALNAACVIDLECKSGRYFYPTKILHHMHKQLQKSNHELRINQVQMVPNDFNSQGRVVISRTYIYRLAFVKNNLFKASFEEIDRCYYINAANFDIDRMREAADMLIGLHDFRSFMRESKEHLKVPSFAIRTINSITIEPSHAHSIHQYHSQNDVEYISITFNARSYVHRQIRRMVYAIIAHGLGKITKRDIYELLTIPSSSAKMLSAPASGLYLTNIEFYEKAMQFKKDDEKASLSSLDDKMVKLENEGENEAEDSHKEEKLP